jgi:OPA family glycerol-3-phosphate transporter-like MFS transporter
MSTSPAIETGNPTRSLQYRQALTIALLFTGYAAYYFCRSDLSIAMPLIIQELQHQGMNGSQAVVRTGMIASFGVIAYAFGKLFLTGLGDLWGGKRNLVSGLAGAVAFTVLFAASGALPLFTLAWIGNRLSQSIGWAGVIKVCSKWFGYSSYAKVAGFLSLSFLVGDAVARQSMGVLLHWGFGWRSLFYYAAAVSAVILIANLFLLRESRVEAGFSEPEVNPDNLFAESKNKSNVFELFRTLFVSPAFLIVCLLSFGTTIVRETFGTWTPTYLHDSFHFSVSAAGGASAVFPALGAVSVILSGWLSDRLGSNRRSIVMFAGLAATAAALLAMATLPPAVSTSVPLVLIGIVAFCLLGPYSYLAGAFALDFGGKTASAAASGLIDGIGYLGGILAGDTVARIAVSFGWRGVFVALAIVSAVSALASCCLVLLRKERTTT